MRVASFVSACLLSATLGGCAIVADPNAWPQKFKYGDSANLASGAGVRFVNERRREMTGREDRPLPTMCTEPSPDVAVAFGTSLSAQASINNQGSGTANASTSEAALALAGRTASVLALRDGLYATCQAYTNGALGQSAYALGLSQYGNLLVALTAHDAGSQGGTTASSTPPSGNNPGAAPPGPTQGSSSNAALFTANDSATAGLLVACVSEYDPTRLGARDPITGGFKTNPVLSQDFCRKYLREMGYILATAK